MPASLRKGIFTVLLLDGNPLTFTDPKEFRAV